MPIAGLVTLHLFQVRRNGDASARLIKKHASRGSIFESLSYTYRPGVLRAVRKIVKPHLKRNQAFLTENL